MIVYKVYSPTVIVDGGGHEGSAYFATKADALQYARELQRDGNPCYVSRLEGAVTRQSLPMILDGMWGQARWKSEDIATLETDDYHD